MAAVSIIFEILYVLIQVALMIILVQAVLSWLLAFNVISLQNDIVRGVWATLEKLTDPLYRPIRKIMPDFGALDLSPMVVIVILIILQRTLPILQASIMTSM
jgi:YggT family protein